MMLTSGAGSVFFKAVVWDEVIPLCECVKYKVIAVVVYVNCGMCSTLG